VGGRLVSDLQLNQATGAVSAVVSRDHEGNQTVHEADAVVFAIGITGERAATCISIPLQGALQTIAVANQHGVHVLILLM